MSHGDQYTGQDRHHGPSEDERQQASRVGGPRAEAGTGSEFDSDLEQRAAAAAVVAEAVALAMEAAAAEAAEAVVAAAAAVTDAAGRAADVAENARRARAFAADTAARSVAYEAVRTAGRVQVRADLAAAQIRQAAQLAAEQIIRVNTDGTGLDAQRIAQLLAATVSAAAEAAARDTVQAAADVAEATAVAAADIAHAVAAADESAESKVTATAAAQRDRASATAAAVALETDARAVGVAAAAQHAAAALVADERDARTHTRMADVDEPSRGTSEPGPTAPGRLVPAARVGADSSDWHTSAVAAELSHDLRVPLSSIVASLEMLQDEVRGRSDQTVATLLARATRGADRMMRMLDQYMSSHTHRRGTSRPTTDLAEVVRQLVLDSSDLLDPVGAVVEAGELPVVSADPDQMYSVLQNLVNNSVKFARPGRPAIVQISARRSLTGWRISVRDNGVGLPDSSALDVFSLFSRGTTAVTGHGIGLATVARIVADEGGQVGATPAETGAEIWFELPDDVPQ